MPVPLLPCEHCRTLVPRFVLEDRAFQAIVRALVNGSKTLAAAELRDFVHCRESEAQAWVGHLLGCAHAWPVAQADRPVLHRIDQAFAGIEKPEHFTDYTHCDECREHDDTLRRRTRDTLRREDLGNMGWDPITFTSEEGIAYLFPTLARYALLPDAWREHSWYGSQLLSHLCWNGEDHRFLAWCSPSQRDAVYALLEHLADTRMADIERGCDEDALLTALLAWRPHEAGV